MGYKHSHVIDTDGYPVNFVLVVDDEIQHYTLQDGEVLVETGIPEALVKPLWNGSTWIENASAEEVAAASPTLDDLKAAKRAEIAAARYASATGVISINGDSYHIDNDSRTSFLGTLAVFQSGALTSTSWKTAGGYFVTLDFAEFMQVATIAIAYINACFGAESSILEQVDAASSAEELAAIVWVAPDVSVVMAGLG